MPYNGAGVYSAPSLPGSFNPPITGQEATGADWSTILADFVAAFSNVICLDGQTTITANIPFNGKKITGLGAATLTGDAVNAGQIVGNALTGIADTGAADAYVIAPTIPITAYVAYQRFQFVSAHANTGATTVAVSSLAAKSIKRPNGDALSANDILSGAIVDIQYDGTNFILLEGGTNAINYSLLTTRGDIITRSATKPQRLATGAAHTFLKSDGTDPGYGNVDLATADVTGVLPRPNGGFTPGDLTNSLSGDVALSNTSNYFTGPTVAQGTSGTWWAAGDVTLTDTNGPAFFRVKLWDGTTVIDSKVVQVPGANNFVSVSLCGRLASPADNIRISVKDITSTLGVILFNQSGESKDSTLTVFRIA